MRTAVLLVILTPDYRRSTGESYRVSGLPTGEIRMTTSSTACIFRLVLVDNEAAVSNHMLVWCK